jgi:hypothetical protein
MNHRKMSFGQRSVRLAMLLLLFLIQDSVLKASDVILSWAANTDADLAGYRVHYGTSSRTYRTTINVGNRTSYTVTGLGAGTYYFSVTAYDVSNNESGFSNEAVASRCDCSADGLSNALDVQMLVNAILAGNKASSYDINRNGTVDVLDLQVLGNVVLGVAACP